MRVDLFVDEGLGHSSYVIDLEDGTAAIVDPPRFPIAQESRIAELGLRLAWTLDTHSHADYVTGSPALSARCGAAFVAPAASRLESPYRPVTDGDRIALASGVEIMAVATPGHTPDHHAYLLIHHDEPVALFSGGSLMVGTVGRTDLCGPDLTVPLAHEMFSGLRRFDALPGDVVVYPTHGAGSFCSAPGASQRTSTLEHERTSNALFAITDEDDFVDRLVNGFGSFPTYFSLLPELNRRGPVRYDTVPRLAALSAEQVNRVLKVGGIIVDARPIAAFSAGHVPGALSNALRPSFGSWLGWLVQPNRPLVFVLDEDQSRDEIVRQCLDVGHENLVGELGGGMPAWDTPVRKIPIVDATHTAGQIVDVRQANEFVEGHVPGALNIELGTVLQANLAGPLTLMCGHGERAMSAASMLASDHDGDLVVFGGGPDTWSAATGRSLEEHK